MTELLNEFQKDNPNTIKIYELLTPENVKYIDKYGNTMLMSAFRYYGVKLNCDANVFHKILDMDCNIQLQANAGHTALMFACRWYGLNPLKDYTVFMRMLQLDCNPNVIASYGKRSVQYYFTHYYKNKDIKVFRKLISLIIPKNYTKDFLEEFCNCDIKHKRLMKTKRYSIIKYRNTNRVKLREKLHSVCS